jgi:hypothetical protein
MLSLPHRFEFLFTVLILMKHLFGYFLDFHKLFFFFFVQSS